MKIVVITAYASIDTAVEAMKRGASDYLTQPSPPPPRTGDRPCRKRSTWLRRSPPPRRSSCCRDNPGNIRELRNVVERAVIIGIGQATLWRKHKQLGR